MKLKINHILILLSISYIITTLLNLNLSLGMFEGSSSITGILFEIISTPGSYNSLFGLSSILLLILPILVLLNTRQKIKEKYGFQIYILTGIGFVSFLSFSYFFNKHIGIDLLTGNEYVLGFYSTIFLLLANVYLIDFIKYISYMKNNNFIKTVLFILLIIITFLGIILFGYIFGNFGSFIYFVIIGLFFYIGSKENNIKEVK